MKPEHSPEPFTNNAVMTFSVGGETYSDCPERFAACYNALRGINPEHVGELVCAVERIVGADDKNDPHELRVWIEEAGDLLAKVKG